jgi:hypothetical protein
MVARYHQKHKLYVKAKGQILVLTLIVMAIGLIVISPMLSYLDTSSSQYAHGLVRTLAFYNADTMMTNLVNDVYSGINIYDQNISSPYSHPGGYLGSDYEVRVSINNSIITSLAAPTQADDWIYMDPGISTCNTSSCDASKLLNALAYGATHDYLISLVAGSKVQVNWTADGEGVCYSSWLIGCWYSTCSYHVGGEMWMVYPNGSTIPGTTVNGTTTSAANTLHLNYSVGTSGNYTIKFKNTNSYRKSGQDIFGGCSGNETQPSYSAAFSGTNDPDFTWVAVGKEMDGVVYTYQDYTITVTARKGNSDIVAVTAYIRHNPGPMAWWKDQVVQIPSWQITYYY